MAFRRPAGDGPSEDRVSAAPRIGVIGASEATPSEMDAAFQVGRALARAGAIVYCGALGGVMEAAARGAREAGGSVVGILPGGRAGAQNPFVTHPVATGMGEARNVVLVRSCECVVAIGGGYGTLSEIAIARKIGVPVVGIGSWRLDEGRGEPIADAVDAEAAVRHALELARRDGGGNG